MEAATMERLMWYQLVDVNCNHLGDEETVTLTHEDNTFSLQGAVRSVFSGSFLRYTAPSDLIVFANHAAMDENRRVSIGNSLQSLGESPEAPIIVRIHRLRQPQTSVRTPLLRWKPEPDPTPVLSHRTFHTVRLDEVVQQLCEVHRNVCSGASNGGVRGFDWWPIALADNLSGMGKSSLGVHYIQQCRDAWPQSCNADGFRESLCAARTLRITFPAYTFSREAACLGPHQRHGLRKRIIDTVTSELAAAVVEQLDLPVGAALPQWLASAGMDPYEDFVHTLVSQIGPVFIVLDSIGRAFTYDERKADSEALSCELFIDFCSVVLGTWMKTTPGVVLFAHGQCILSSQAQSQERLSETPAVPTGLCSSQASAAPPTRHCGDPSAYVGGLIQDPDARTTLGSPH